MIAARAGQFGEMDKTFLSLGHGYSARALAARLLPQGWRIIGTTRSPEKLKEIAATGVDPMLWPGDDLSALLQEVPNLLVSAGPGPEEAWALLKKGEGETQGTEGAEEKYW